MGCEEKVYCYLKSVQECNQIDNLYEQRERKLHSDGDFIIERETREISLNIFPPYWDKVDEHQKSLEIKPSLSPDTFSGTVISGSSEELHKNDTSFKSTTNEENSSSASEGDYLSVSEYKPSPENSAVLEDKSQNISEINTEKGIVSTEKEVRIIFKLIRVFCLLVRNILSFDFSSRYFSFYIM